MPGKKLDNAVTDFMHATGLLVRRIRAAAASEELSWTESLVMARLAKDGPATTAVLARAEGMKPQSMGTTVAATRFPPVSGDRVRLDSIVQRRQRHA